MELTFSGAAMAMTDSGADYIMTSFSAVTVETMLQEAKVTMKSSDKKAMIISRAIMEKTSFMEEKATTS